MAESIAPNTMRAARFNERGEAERERRARAEQDRRAADEERERVAEAASAKERDEALAEAKKHGLEAVDLRHGVLGVIGGIRDGGLSLDMAKRVAIGIGDVDEYLVAFQVVDQNNVLFRYEDVTVWLRNYRRSGGENTWLEGARLTAMDYRFVAIRGIKPYRTLLGTKQAIVIEPVF